MWDRPITEVDVYDVVAVLQPIWFTKLTTATRLRGRIERVFAAAKALKYRAGENPAAWKENLQTLLADPAKLAQIKQKSHHPALPWQDVPAFMAALSQIDTVPARALA